MPAKKTSVKKNPVKKTSARKAATGMEMVREYSMKYYGRILDTYEILGRYLPDAMAKWIELRKSVFQEPPIGALTLKEKQLVLVAIEVSNLKPNPEGHARRFIRYGGTPKEIAEVAALCILIAGMETYQIGGNKALKAAEEEYEKLHEKK